MSEELVETVHLPEMNTFIGDGPYIRRENDDVVVFISFDCVPGIAGATVELSPTSARAFAAELMNIADQIEPFDPTKES